MNQSDADNQGMQFGGIQKNSFIDYPKKISAVLFFSGCTISDAPIATTRLLQESFQTRFEEDAYAFLQARQGLLEQWSGGEPTLCNDIFRICRNIKSMGYPIKLDTMAAGPIFLGRLLEEELVDVAMDIKTDPEGYGPPLAPFGSGQAVLKSIDLLMREKYPTSFAPPAPRLLSLFP